MSENKRNNDDFCLLCGESPSEALPVAERLYYRCPACGSAWLDRDEALCEEAERQRYLLHDNSLENTGYRNYLNGILETVLAGIGPEIKEIRRVFDYGCGPYPALVRLFAERGYDSRGWDPLFQSGVLPFPGGADLSTCVEVVEHFLDPESGFKGLAEATKIGGYCAIATQLIPFERDEFLRFFPSWWYRQDPTHVTFYTPEGLKTAAARAGLRFLSALSPTLLLFRRDLFQ